MTFVDKWWKETERNKIRYQYWELYFLIFIVLLEVWIPAENFSGVILYSIVLIGGFYDGVSLVGGRIENRPVVNICSRE